MPRFSANLGFLWADLALPEAIRAAARAGFDAVECHWPYATPPGEVAAALRESGLEMLGLNTARGGDGAFGLSALPGQEAAARAAIDQALDYAARTGTQAVHVMAGMARGDAAHQAFISNLRYGCAAAKGSEITLLIEPLNRHDAPGYFLNTTGQALEIIEEIGDPRLRLMFDCYHVGQSGGDVIARLDACLPQIGHIQFAALPDRGPPDHGPLDYTAVFAHIDALGWTRPLGAEYRVGGATESSLGWLAQARGQTGAQARGQTGAGE